LKNIPFVHAMVRSDSTVPTNGTTSEKVWEPLLHGFFCLGCKEVVRFAALLVLL